MFTIDVPQKLLFPYCICLGSWSRNYLKRAALLLQSPSRAEVGFPPSSSRAPAGWDKGLSYKVQVSLLLSKVEEDNRSLGSPGRAGEAKVLKFCVRRQHDTE
eukprot:3001600-Rhodomonas_salina.6